MAGRLGPYLCCPPRAPGLPAAPSRHPPEDSQDVPERLSPLPNTWVGRMRRRRQMCAGGQAWRCCEAGGVGWRRGVLQEGLHRDRKVQDKMTVWQPWAEGPQSARRPPDLGDEEPTRPPHLAAVLPEIDYDRLIEVRASAPSLGGRKESSWLGAGTSEERACPGRKPRTGQGGDGRGCRQGGSQGKEGRRVGGRGYGAEAERSEGFPVPEGPAAWGLPRPRRCGRRPVLAGLPRCECPSQLAEASRPHRLAPWVLHSHHPGPFCAGSGPLFRIWSPGDHCPLPAAAQLPWRDEGAGCRPAKLRHPRELGLGCRLKRSGI